MTTSFTESVTLALPAAEAFALVSDYRHDPAWRRGVLDMRPSTPGPAATGTTTEETIRFLGRTYVNPGRVVRVDGLRLDWEAESETTRASGRRTVTPIDAHTSRFTYEVTVELLGAGRVVNAILGRLFRRQVRKDLRRLREVARERAQVALGDLAA